MAGKKKETGAKGAAAAKVTDRAALKKQLRALKAEREAARSAGDGTKLARIRDRYRRVNARLRRTAPPKPKAKPAE